MTGGNIFFEPLDALPDRALFSIYHRTREAPPYLIEERPAAL